MADDDLPLEVRFGRCAAGANLLLTVIVASLVATGGSSASEMWIFMAIADLPLWLVVLCLPNIPMERWQNIDFLPWSLGDWNRFLFPFLLFAIAGSAGWYLVGWLFGRFTRHFRYRS